MKKLFTLLICAFAVISANAWTVTFSSDNKTAYIEGSGSDGGNATDLGDTNTQNKIKAAETLIFSGTINTLNPFQGLGCVATTVDYRGATFQETEGTPISYTTWDPSSKSYVSGTVTPTTNCMTFKHFKQCSTAYLANVKSICYGCFDSNAAMTTTFTIPSTVQYIAGHAVDNTPITNITIPANVKYIANQAFQNADIKALIDVTVEGYTYAANGAFDKQTTVGQTDADYPAYATLHFPKGAEEYFQNQNDPLTQAISLNKGKFQAWLNSHYETADDGDYANGWREFMNSGGGDPTPVPEGETVVLRTFSDNVARLVPLNFRAYLVTGLTPVTDGYAVELVQIFAIPANTGVILYGEVPAGDTGYTLSHITAWDKGQTNYVAPYNRNSTTATDAEGTSVTIKNYMVPTVETTKLYPFYKDMTSADWTSSWPLATGDGLKAKYSSGTTVTDRNFILSTIKTTTLKNKSSNDYIGFFRVKPNVNCGPNKAYLSLPADIYASAKGAEAIVLRPEDPATMKFRFDNWYDDWGKRGSIGVLQAKFAGEMFFDEDPTGIQNVNTETIDGGYYTLQGVKVAQPQKGVYVKNGKKVIIK